MSINWKAKGTPHPCCWPFFILHFAFCILTSAFPQQDPPRASRAECGYGDEGYSIQARIPFSCPPAAPISHRSTLRRVGVLAHRVSNATRSGGRIRPPYTEDTTPFSLSQFHLIGTKCENARTHHAQGTAFYSVIIAVGGVPARLNQPMCQENGKDGNNELVKKEIDVVRSCFDE